jgi:hypothetical protein
LLEPSGGNVGFFRWFATWPPAQNEGFTVPSAIARSAETHPPELSFLNELVHPTGAGSYVRGALQLVRHGGRLTTFAKAGAEFVYETLMKPDQLDWWYRRRLVEAAVYSDVFTHLLRTYRPRFSAVLLYHTDDLGHRYWRYRQPELFVDVPLREVRRYGDVIDQGYITSDKAIGRILDVVPRDALVVVLSDHGQQAAGATRKAPYRMSPEIFELLGFQGRVWMTYIGYSGSIRARSNQDGSQTLEALSSALQQVRLLSSREPLFDVSAEDSNQLMVDVDLDIEAASLEDAVLLPIGQQVRLGSVVFSDGRISGSHSEWGVMIMKGPGVRAGHRFQDASILDVVPTVLALKGRPVAQDMDGQVIMSAIEDSFLGQNPVCRIDSYETKTGSELDIPLSTGEERELEVRLRGLGYLS